MSLIFISFSDYQFNILLTLCRCRRKDKTVLAVFLLHLLHHIIFPLLLNSGHVLFRDTSTYMCCGNMLLMESLKSGLLIGWANDQWPLALHSRHNPFTSPPTFIALLITLPVPKNSTQKYGFTAGKQSLLKYGGKQILRLLWGSSEAPSLQNLTEIWFHCWKEILVEIWWITNFEAPSRLLWGSREATLNVLLFKMEWMNRRFGSAWGLPEMRSIPDMCHTCPSVANSELCEPEKKNYPVLRTLVPRPTSHRKWVGEPD